MRRAARRSRPRRARRSVRAPPRSPSGYHATTSSSEGGTGFARSMPSSSRWTASPISVARHPGLAGDAPVLVDRPHADDALGVEAVRAALEERERRVRESPDGLDRRRGDGLERGERGHLDDGRDALGVEQRELVFLLDDRHDLDGLGRVAVDRDPQARLAALDLAVLELGELEPVEHPADRRRRASRASRRRPSRRRSAGRSRASSRRSRGAGARPPRPPPPARAPRRSRTPPGASRSAG